MTLKIKVHGKDRCLLKVEFVTFTESDHMNVYIKRDGDFLLPLPFQWIGSKRGKYNILNVEIISEGNPMYGHVLHSQHHEFKQECWLYL
ncbi:MAG TPA: hypothetical protein VJC20_02455 [Candidatus Paceibacterota bacterium]